MQKRPIRIYLLKRKGRIHFIKSIVEKPEPALAPSEYAMTGKYILTPKIFDYLEALLKNRKNNEEIKLANALRDYAKVQDLYGYECKSRHFDTGTKLDLVKAEVVFALNHPEIGKQARFELKEILN